MKRHLLIGVALVCLACAGAGCAPNTFVRGQSSGWKSIELNPTVKGKYDLAWQKTVDTIARDYDIEIMDKDSGYLRTGWTYGIAGGSFTRYRGRLTVKFPAVKDPGQLDVKTDAQWLLDNSYWIQGFDRSFNRDVFTALSGRLGRTVPGD